MGRSCISWRLQLPRHFVKVTSFHALKTCRGSSYIAALILKLSTTWMWAVNFTPWLLYTQESTLVPIALEALWYPLHWRLGGSQSLCGGEKILLLLPLWNPYHPAHSLIINTGYTILAPCFFGSSHNCHLGDGLTTGGSVSVQVWSCGSWRTFPVMVRCL
jgi:hypothetical protein